MADPVTSDDTIKAEQEAAEGDDDEGSDLRVHRAGDVDWVRESIPEDLQDFSEQCFLLEYAGNIHKAFSETKILRKMDKGGTIRRVVAITGSSHENYDVRSITHLPETAFLAIGGEKPNKAQGETADMNSNIQYISNLTIPDSSKQTRRFFEVTSDKVAQMVPYIKIAIDIYSKDAKFEGSIPIRFKQQTKRGIFTSRGEREGAGIQSISVDLDGIDVATEKIVSLNASFVFQDFRRIFNTLYTKTVNGQKISVRYSDLLSYNLRSDKGDLYKKLNFKIGWAANSSLEAELGLEQKRLSIDAQIIKYSFDFRPDGSVIINVSYRGMIEGVLNGPEANVLSMVRADMAELSRRMAAETEDVADRFELRNNSEKRESQVRQIAILVFKEQLLQAHLPQQTRSSPDTLKWRINASGGTPKLLTAPVIESRLAELSGQAPTDSEMDAIYGQIMDYFNKYFDSQTGEISVANYNDLQNAFTIMMAAEVHNEKVTIDNVRNARRNARTELLKQMSLIRLEGLRDIAKRLYSKSKIYHIKLSENEKFFLNRDYITEQGARSAFDLPASVMTPQVTAEEPAWWLPIKRSELDRGKTQLIPFVFLGEFLQTLLSLADKRPPSVKPQSGSGTVSPRTIIQLINESYSAKFKVDLGFIHYSGPFTNIHRPHFPLYFLPLSLKRLNNWFARNIVGKELTFYSFKNFTRDIIREFLVNAHQNCRLNTEQKRALLPNIDFVFGETRVGKTRERQKVWFIYGTQTTITDIKDKDFASYNANMKKKIFHFYIGGQDRGILKSVKLVDNTNPNLKSGIYLRNKVSGQGVDVDGSDQGLLPPLVFKIEVETLGASSFHLGQMVFLDARQFISQDINKIFKISGYYRIYKVAHTISRETFSTKFTAILQESIDDFQKRTRMKFGTATDATKKNPSPIVPSTTPDDDSSPGTAQADKTAAKGMGALSDEINKLKAREKTMKKIGKWAQWGTLRKKTVNVTQADLDWYLEKGQLDPNILGGVGAVKYVQGQHEADWAYAQRIYKDAMQGALDVVCVDGKTRRYQLAQKSDTEQQVLTGGEIEPEGLATMSIKCRPPGYKPNPVGSGSGSGCVWCGKIIIEDKDSPGKVYIKGAWHKLAPLDPVKIVEVHTPDTSPDAESQAIDCEGLTAEQCAEKYPDPY